MQLPLSFSGLAGLGEWIGGAALAILVILVVGLALSQTALAFQIRYRDSSSGSDRTFTLGVKGGGKISITG